MEKKKTVEDALCISSQQTSSHTLKDDIPPQRFATLGLVEHLSPKYIPGSGKQTRYTST